MRSCSWLVSVWRERPVAETMPSVTVRPPSGANALPMATTSSPTWRSVDEPSGAATRPDVLATFRSARSLAVSDAMTVAARGELLPGTVTSIVLAPSITWALVRMVPSVSRTMPVPAPVAVPEPPKGPWFDWVISVLTETTDGSTLARISPTSRSLPAIWTLARSTATDGVELSARVEDASQPPTEPASIAVAATPPTSARRARPGRLAAPVSATGPPAGEVRIGGAHEGGVVGATGGEGGKLARG